MAWRRGALAIQAAFNGAEVADGIKLTLHIGVGCGEAIALHIGGWAGRWHFLIAGSAVQQTGLTVGEAGPGETVLSPEAWALVRPVCTGQDRPTGYIQLTAVHASLPPQPSSAVLLPAASRTALAAYLPTPLATLLVTGYGDWLAELRRVSVLFLNLLDLDVTADGVLDRTQRVMDVAQPVIDHYEGSILEFVVDDKGATVVALFGLPPQAHEDDAARCVRAGGTLQASLDRYGQRSAIGIATGRASCGVIGNGLRREYRVVGDVMNLAARLMGQAGTGILCDAITVQMAGSRLPFDLLPPIQVKGRSGPVPIFSPAHGPTPPLSTKAPATRMVPPLVGRNPERTVVQNVITSLEAGLGSALIIEGEAGFGKSRLITYLLEQAGARGITAMVGAADAIERATPYSGLRPIFTQLLGLDRLREAMPAVRREHVLSQLIGDPELERLAPLLSEVVEVEFSDTDLTRAMTPEARASSTRELLVSLLKQRATSLGADLAPLAVILDDAQWLDSSSWTLAWQMHQQAIPLLLVLATRPLAEPLPMEYIRLRESSGNIHWLVLSGMTPGDTAALVSNRLGVRTLAAPLATLIQERAEGNPLAIGTFLPSLRRSRELLAAESIGSHRSSSSPLRLQASSDGFSPTVPCTMSIPSKWSAHTFSNSCTISRGSNLHSRRRPSPT